MGVFGVWGWHLDAALRNVQGAAAERSRIKQESAETLIEEVFKRHGDTRTTKQGDLEEYVALMDILRYSQAELNTQYRHLREGQIVKALKRHWVRETRWIDGRAKKVWVRKAADDAVRNLPLEF